MAKKNLKVKVDTINGLYKPEGTIKQLDSVFFNIEVTEEGEKKDLTGQTIKLFARKSDGKMVEQSSGISITNAEQGELTIDLLNAAVQAPGYVYFELEISDGNGIISTADFVYKVIPKVGSDEAIESTNEVSTLKKVEAYIAKAKVELEEFKKIQNEVLETNGNVNTQEALRVSAEIKREEAEIKREEAENSRGIRLKEIEENKYDNVELSGNSLKFYAKDMIKKSIILNVAGGEGNGGSSLNMRDPLPGEIFEIANAPLPPAATYGNIVLSKTSITIIEGQSDTFTVKLDKAPTNNQTVTLTKNNNDVTLNPTSLTFTPQNYNSAQTVTITVAEDNADYSNESCTVTLSSPNVANKTLEVSITDNDEAPSNIPVQSITLNHSESTLQVNRTLQLTPIFNPSDATNKNVTWDSNNKGFATVSQSGLVTGVGEGNCTITCTTQDGNKTASCNLQIENNQEAHDGYVKENLKAYYNFTKYPDGYSGDVEDLSGNNLIPNVTGLEYYTTGRNGIINGSLMLNTHKIIATQLEIPTDSSFTTYPFSIELFAAFRIYYNIYKPDNELVFGNETITDKFIINTREGGTTGNGYFIRASENGDIDIVGTLSQPLVQDIHSELNIAKLENPTLKYQHLVIVLDRNLQKVYIDGNLISETNQGSTILDGSSNRVMKICQNILKANLKLVRLYNSVLTDKQVLQNYNDTMKIME